METVIQTFLDLTANMGEWGVFVLMTIESSFVPFPSELAIPPAAYLASQGVLSMTWILIAAIAGSMLGASINYFLARFLGRLVVYSIVDKGWLRFCLISRRKVEKAESYFDKHGNMSTFFGRLVPVIRQLISLPAGFIKMNYLSFCFYTFLGASIWAIFLALTGYYFGEYQDVVIEYYKVGLLIFIGLILIVTGIIYFVKRRRL